MNAQIKAKVSVVSVSEYSLSEASEKAGENILMEPVHSDSEENKSFSDATPNGRIELTITNKSAWGFFVSGKQYFVDFTAAS